MRLPELPPELWQRILQLALPPTTSRLAPDGDPTWNARAETLRACSLVCSTWRDIAQRLLLSCALVGEKALPLFLNTVAASPDLARSVRVLKLYGGHRDTQEEWGARVETLLPYLAGLRELCLTRVGELDLAVLRLAPQLERLHCWGSGVDLSVSPPFTLSSLRELSICGTVFKPSTMPFFSVASLPNLRAAAICYTRSTLTGDSTNSHLLDSHPSSLFVLATSTPRSSLPSCSTAPHTVYTLRQEALDWSESPLGTSCGAGDGIEHLHLTDLHDVPPGDMLASLRCDTSLQRLKTLYLTRPGEKWVEEEDLARYTAEGKRRGIEIVWLQQREFMEESLFAPEMLDRHVAQA
ncbi:hypothetical protein JCM10213_000741 [Rhodosporidiobolus nylandii]